MSNEKVDFRFECHKCHHKERKIAMPETEWIEFQEQDSYFTCSQCGEQDKTTSESYDNIGPNGPFGWRMTDLEYTAYCDSIDVDYFHSLKIDIEDLKFSYHDGEIECPECGWKEREEFIVGPESTASEKLASLIKDFPTCPNCGASSEQFISKTTLRVEDIWEEDRKYFL